MDDGHNLLRPEDGVPHAHASSSSEHELSYFSSAAPAVAHNPYPCFGAPGGTWPRGFPLGRVQDEQTSMCNVTLGDDRDSGSNVGESDDGGRVDGRRRRIGVVQALANNEPDVDAIYRLTRPFGALPISFDQESPAQPSGSRQLRVIPASTFTPYNAQVNPQNSHQRLTTRSERRVS